MNPEMEARDFEAAMKARWFDPDLTRLTERFDWALRQSDGDIYAAMAAVNEALTTPVTYSEFFARLERAA